MRKLSELACAGPGTAEHYELEGEQPRPDGAEESAQAREGWAEPPPEDGVERDGDGKHLLDLIAVVLQHPQERAAREQAPVRDVEDAALGVGELAEEEVEPDGHEGDVRGGQDDRRRPGNRAGRALVRLAQLEQELLRLVQMLDDVEH